MEIKKNTKLLLLGTFCASFFAFTFGSAPATIKLYKMCKQKDDKGNCIGDDYDYKIEIAGTNLSTKALFRKSGWTPSSLVNDYEGLYENLTRMFIPKNQDRFIFDSKSIESYISTINRIQKPNEYRITSYVSRIDESMRLESEKARLRKAVINLNNALRSNLFDYILNDVNQFPAGQQAEHAAESMCKELQKQPEGTKITVTSEACKSNDIDLLRSIYEEAQEFCKHYKPSKTPPPTSVAIKIDLYGESPVNQSARTIYWLVQDFCKAIGVSSKSIYSWVSASGIKTGLWYTGLAGGAAAALGLGYFALKNPGGFSSGLSTLKEGISQMTTTPVIPDVSLPLPKAP